MVGIVSCRASCSSSSRTLTTVVPAPLQLDGNEPVRRIDFVVLTMRACGLEPSLLKRILQLLSFFQSFLSMISHCSHGSLDAEWLQSIKDLLGNGAINSQAPERGAAFVSTGLGLVATNVSLQQSASAVGDPQFSPAASAPKKTHEQGLASAN